MAINYKYKPYSPKLPKEIVLGPSDDSKEKAIKSLQTQKDNLEQRLEEAGGGPDTRNFLEKIFNLPQDQSFLMDAIELYNRPLETVKGLVSGLVDDDPTTDPLKQALEGFTGERGMTSFRETIFDPLLQTNTDELPGIQKFGIEFAGDLVLDPFTYGAGALIGKAFGKIGKIGSKALDPALVDAAYSSLKTFSDYKNGVTTAAAKVIPEEKFLKDFLGDGIDDVTKEGLEQLAKKTARAGDTGEIFAQSYLKKELKKLAKSANLSDDVFEVVAQGTRQANGRNLKDLAIYAKHTDVDGLKYYIEVAKTEVKDILHSADAFAISTTLTQADLANAGKALESGTTPSLGKQFIDTVGDVKLKNGENITSYLKKNLSKPEALSNLTDVSKYANSEDAVRVTEAIGEMFFGDLTASNVDFITFRVGTGVDDIITLSTKSAKKYLKFKGGFKIPRSGKALTKSSILANTKKIFKKAKGVEIVNASKVKKLSKEALERINQTAKYKKITPRANGNQILVSGINETDILDAIKNKTSFTDGLLEVYPTSAAPVEGGNKYLVTLSKKNLGTKSTNLLTQLELIDEAGVDFTKINLSKIDESKEFLGEIVKNNVPVVEEISLLRRLTDETLPEGIRLTDSIFSKPATQLRNALSGIKKYFNAGAGFTKEQIRQMSRIGGESSQFFNEFNERLAVLSKRAADAKGTPEVLTKIVESGAVLTETGYSSIGRALTPQEIFENIKINTLDASSRAIGYKGVLLPSFQKGAIGRRNAKAFADTLNSLYIKNIDTTLPKTAKVFEVKISAKAGTEGAALLKFKGGKQGFKVSKFKKNFRKLMAADGMSSRTLKLGRVDLADDVVDFWRQNQDLVSEFQILRDDLVNVLKGELGFNQMADILGGKQGYLRHTITKEALDVKRSLQNRTLSKYAVDGVDMLKTRRFLGTADDVNKGLKAYFDATEDIFDMNIQKSMEDLIQVTGERLEQHRTLDLLLKGADNNNKAFFQVVEDTTGEAQILYGKDFKILSDDFQTEFGQIYKGLDPQSEKVLREHLASKGFGTPGKKIAIHNTAYNYLKRVNRAFEKLPGFIKGYDTFLNAWKSVTLVSAGYHIRNFLGNATNSFLAGMGFTQQTRYAKKAFVDFGRYKKVKNAIAEITPRQIDEVFKGLGKEGRTAVKQLQFEGILNRPSRYEVDDLIRFGIDRKDAESFKKVQEFMESGASQSHRGVRDLESVKKMTKEGKKNVVNKVVELNYNAAEAADNYQRYMLYQWSFDRSLKSGQRSGLNSAEALMRAQGDAATSVSEALFDYSHLTTFEKQYMKRLFPFYTFFKNNIIFQAKNIIARPGQYARLGRLYKNYVENVAGMDVEAMPDYMRDNMWLPIPFKLTKNDTEAIGFLKSNLPISDFTQIVENPFREGANFITTPVKLIFEMATEEELFTGRNFFGDIERLDSERGVLSFLRDEKGNLSFNSGIFQKFAQDMGLRVPMNYASVLLDLLDTTLGYQGLAEGGNDLFTRLGIISSQTEQNLKYTNLYQDLEKLRNSKAAYERTTGEKLPKKKKEKTGLPEIPGLDEYLRGLGG